MATPMGSSARRERLRSLAEADQLDEEIIFAAEARKRTRQAERQALSTSPILDITINQPTKSTFHTIILRFCQYWNHSNRHGLALQCADCGGEPDDPVLTNCCCLYCTECFTKVLAAHPVRKRGRRVKVRYTQCVASEDDHITDCVVLDASMWAFVLNTVGTSMNMDVRFPSGLTGHTVQEAKINRYNSAYGDVETLWHSLNWVDDKVTIPKTSSDHEEQESEVSADSNDDDMDSNHDTMDDPDLDRDAFRLQENYRDAEDPETTRWITSSSPASVTTEELDSDDGSVMSEDVQALSQDDAHKQDLAPTSKNGVDEDMTDIDDEEHDGIDGSTEVVHICDCSDCD